MEIYAKKSTIVWAHHSNHATMATDHQNLLGRINFIGPCDRIKTFIRLKINRKYKMNLKYLNGLIDLPHLDHQIDAANEFQIDLGDKNRRKSEQKKWGFELVKLVVTLFLPTVAK